MATAATITYDAGTVPGVTFSVVQGTAKSLRATGTPTTAGTYYVYATIAGTQRIFLINVSHDYETYSATAGNAGGWARVNAQPVSYVGESPSTQTVDQGASMTIEAYSNTEGYEFERWTSPDDESWSSTSALLRFSAGNSSYPHNYIAWFRGLNTHTISVAVSPAGYGTVQPTASTSVLEGSTIAASGPTLFVGDVSYVATPSATTDQYSYAFFGWSNVPSDGKVTDDRTITANFTRTNRYTCSLTYKPNAGGGTVTGMPTPNPVTYTSESTANHRFTVSSATPSRRGFRFLGWSESSSDTTPMYVGGNQVSVSYNGAKDLYAIWQALPLTITGPSDVWYNQDPVMLTISGNRYIGATAFEVETESPFSLVLHDSSDPPTIEVSVSSNTHTTGTITLTELASGRVATFQVTSHISTVSYSLSENTVTVARGGSKTILLTYQPSNAEDWDSFYASGNTLGTVSFSNHYEGGVLVNGTREVTFRGTTTGGPETVYIENSISGGSKAVTFTVGSAVTIDVPTYPASAETGQMLTYVATVSPSGKTINWSASVPSTFICSYDALSVSADTLTCTTRVTAFRPNAEYSSADPPYPFTICAECEGVRKYVTTNITPVKSTEVTITGPDSIANPNYATYEAYANGADSRVTWQILNASYIADIDTQTEHTAKITTAGNRRGGTVTLKAIARDNNSVYATKDILVTYVHTDQIFLAGVEDVENYDGYIRVAVSGTVDFTAQPYPANSNDYIFKQVETYSHISANMTGGGAVRTVHVSGVSLGTDVITLYSGYDEYRKTATVLTEVGYDVTFDWAYDSIVDHIPTNSEGHVDKYPAMRQRENYEFLGWFLESTHETELTEDMTFDAPVTVYAYWRRTYTVQFKCAPTTMLVEPEYITNISEGSPVEIDGPVIRIDGRRATPEYMGDMSFERWSIADGTLITADLVDDDAVIAYLTKTFRWKYQVPVSVVIDQGVDSFTASVPGVTFTLTDNVLSATGAPSMTGNYVIEIVYIEEYGGETVEDAVIVFDAGHGYVTTELRFGSNTPDGLKITSAIGEPISLPVQVPFTQGNIAFLFDGWHTESQATTLRRMNRRSRAVTDTVIEDGYVPLGDMVVYAHWREHVIAPLDLDVNCYLSRYWLDDNETPVSKYMYIPNVQSITESNDVTVQEISTIIYGFDNNFTMDLGTVQRFSLSFTRVNPRNAVTSGTDQTKWANGYWYRKLMEFLDGWQNLNYGFINNELVRTGGFGFYYRPIKETYRGNTNDYATLYPVHDRIVFISGQVEMGISNSDPMKMDITIPMVSATMIRRTEEYPSSIVTYNSGSSGTTYIKQQAFPTITKRDGTNVLAVAMDCPQDWMLAKQGEMFDSWHAGNQVIAPWTRFDAIAYPTLTAAWKGVDSVLMTTFNTEEESGTWTIPANANYMMAHIVGTGGAGGESLLQIPFYPGGAGGSGGYRMVKRSVLDVAGIEYYVGRDKGMSYITLLNSNGSEIGTYGATNGGNGRRASVAGSGAPGAGGIPDGAPGVGTVGGAVPAIIDFDIISNGTSLINGPYTSLGGVPDAEFAAIRDGSYGGGGAGGRQGAPRPGTGALGFIIVAFYE